MMTNSSTPYDRSTAIAYDEDFYRKAILQFIRTTGCPLLQLHTQDPMSGYILSTTRHSEISRLALDSKLGNRVYTDTLMLFVSQYLQKMNFHQQRCRFEKEQITEATHWSTEKREQEWEDVLNKIQRKYDIQGFSKIFYEREWTATSPEGHTALWYNMLDEWHRHLDLGLQLQKENYIQQHKAQHNQTLLHNLMDTKEYVLQKNLSYEDVFQTLALMGGRWTSVEFERLLKITHLQYKYPILLDIAHRMGRCASPDGSQRVQSVSGLNTSMRSSARNDISGIGVGRDFESLLPSEMACFGDPELHDIFLKKFVTGRLQTFDHKSHILRSARSLRTQAAATRGPVIVCMDTSGSMMGEPSQIALSLMMRLAEMCEEQARECFLITFSVYAKPIDVRHNRAQLIQYFTQQASGNTDAQRMIHVLEEVLQKNNRYAGADVLWISDFRIPFPPSLYLQILQSLRQSGTRLYGLQIGMAENHWTNYFDYIYHMDEVKLAIV